MVKKLFGKPTGLVAVDGSIELLRFMARMEDTLTRDHVSLIWRSGERGPEFQVWPKSTFLWDPRGTKGPILRNEINTRCPDGFGVLISCCSAGNKSQHRIGRFMLLTREVSPSADEPLAGCFGHSRIALRTSAFAWPDDTAFKRTKSAMLHVRPTRLLPTGCSRD